MSASLPFLRPKKAKARDEVNIHVVPLLGSITLVNVAFFSLLLLLLLLRGRKVQASPRFIEGS